MRRHTAPTWPLRPPPSPSPPSGLWLHVCLRGPNECHQVLMTLALVIIWANVIPLDGGYDVLPQITLTKLAFTLRTSSQQTAQQAADRLGHTNMAHIHLPTYRGPGNHCNTTLNTTLKSHSNQLMNYC